MFFLGCVLVLLGSSLVFVSLIGFLCSGWGSSICSFFGFLALVRLGCRSRSSGLGALWVAGAGSLGGGVRQAETGNTLIKLQE